MTSRKPRMIPGIPTVMAVFFSMQLASQGFADPLADAVVDWVVSKGGYFSEKIVIRGMDPQDPSSPLGVFAVADINPKETLFEIPHSCYIALWDDAVEVDDHDPEEAEHYWENICLLSRKLANEINLGQNSSYAPFIDYVRAQKHGQLPATWSKAGKDALRSLLPSGSDVVDWIEKYFKGTCIDENDEFQEHIVATTVQRCYDTALIPVWDMVNHWNGRNNTENGSVFAGDKLQVRASTLIRKGEEVYTSYDECADCGEQMYYWGTPEILRDFGFVESPAQKWVFYDEGIWFMLAPSDYSNDSSELEVIWDTEEVPESYDSDDLPDGIPDTDGINFMRGELKRLNDVAKFELEEQGSIPKYEWDTIMQYYTAATLALSKAIDAAVVFRDKEL